jgi:transcription elongation factor
MPGTAVLPGAAVFAKFGFVTVDVDGLLGSVLDRDGYAFALDTFVLVASLLPVARYNSSYARAIGKWATNAANAARLFFPSSLPPEQQTDWGWVSANGAEALAYERQNDNPLDGDDRRLCPAAWRQRGAEDQMAGAHCHR